MATLRPRITVTLTNKQHEVLRSISETSGQSMSTFISGILDVSMPTLERMAIAFHKIKQVQDSQRQKIASELDAVQDAIEPVVQDVVGQFDMFMAQIERSADAAIVGDAQPRAPKIAALADDSAPATNRGATPTTPKPRKPASDKALRPVSQVKKSIKK